jgi:hypothetical protein
MPPKGDLMTKLKVEPIPGFSALQMKEELQRRVQEQLAGLSPEERRRALQSMLLEGPWAEKWEQMRPPACGPDESGEAQCEEDTHRPVPTTT